MSDEEEVYSEEEEEVKKPEGKTEEQKAGEAEFIKRQEQKKSDLDEQLKEYIQEWRKQRAKEEDELKKLKDKQTKRKALREQEEKRLADKKRTEEERRMREAEEKKQREQEEKMRRLEEAEKKRQLMLQAQKASMAGKNFMVSKKSDGSPMAGTGSSRQELNKTKEQLEEEKRISLSFRIKPLDLSGMGIDSLKKKASELWDQIVKLETEKYDLEERQKRQDYDLKELKERQKQQLRHKALKRGLDPEALTGKYPPKIQVASKYERRVDTRSYEDKKKLFEGGLEGMHKENMEKAWAENAKSFDDRQKTKLPKWFGERPGKKKGEPESPEEEEVKAAEIEEPTYEAP
jgi:troponin T